MAERELESVAEFDAWVGGIDSRISSFAERIGIPLDFSSQSLDAVGDWTLANFESEHEIMTEPGQVSLNQIVSYAGEMLRRSVPGTEWSWRAASDKTKGWPFLLMPNGSRRDVMNGPRSKLRRRVSGWGDINKQEIADYNKRFSKYGAATGRARWTGEIRYMALVFTTREVQLNDLVSELERVKLPVHMSVEGHIQSHVDDWILEITWRPLRKTGAAETFLRKFCDGESEEPPQGADLSDFEAYTHVYGVRGGPDPNMDYFNNWLFGIERVLHFDPSAVWDNHPPYS